MIEESEIAAFPAEKQVAIRMEIDALVKNGVDPRFLSLSRTGEVLHDVEAEGDAIVADYFKKKP